MNPRILIGILFLITFTVSFLIYLLVVNVINPHIDLSNTAKNKIEVAPELDQSMFGKNKNNPLSKSSNPEENVEAMYQSDIEALMTDDDSNNMEETADDKQETDNSAVKAPGDQKIDTGGLSLDTKEEKLDIDLDAKSTGESGFEPDSNYNTTVNDSNGPKNKIEQLDVTNSTVQKVEPTAELPKNKQNTNTDVQNTSISRVVVGSYSSVEDAKKAYDKMLDSEMRLAPIIKEVGGSYTLQVGAFSDKNKANDLVNKLNNNNYSAKIVSD